MATAALKKKRSQPVFLSAASTGMLLSPEEFDRADGDDDWRYELINGVVVVSPIPSIGEADPNEELGYWLRNYAEDHPKGAALNATLSERYVFIGGDRRRADRVIWAGLGRLPRKRETPTVVAEFVSKRKRYQVRDYETKRDEYILRANVSEYWVIDRFRRIMTVFTLKAGKVHPRVLKENQVYKTSLLPGFELPLAKLLAKADRWAEEDEV